MYRVEMDDREDAEPVVLDLAAYLDAKFNVRMILETENERLAKAVGALMGKVVECDQPHQMLPEIHFPEGAGILREAGEAIAGEIKAAIQDLTQTAVEAGPVTVSTETPRKNGKPKTEPKSGSCRYCGDPLPPRWKVCQKKECKSKESHDWNARHVAKKAAQAAAALPKEEAAESEDFLASQMFLTPTAEGLVTKTFSSLQAAIREGTAPDGTRLRARPSGKFYTVSAGRLVPSPEPARSTEAVPGAAETA